MVAAAVMVAATPSSAHGVGFSQRKLPVDGRASKVTGRSYFHDARIALGLDPQRTGETGWQDLAAREASLRAYVM
jgi:hypothetical protein